jgi:hypothetical protein
MKIGQVVYNTNDRIYVVLAHDNDYTLLLDNTLRVDEDGRALAYTHQITPFVVAYGVKELPDGYITWSQGRYTTDIQNAVAVYQKKIGGKQ